MRVTAETKAATRERILAAARQLFLANGFDASTTRDIADSAGIATGTLFNYFPAKEAILASLAAQAIEDVQRAFEADSPAKASFEAELFAYVAAGLRKLKPFRKHLPVLLESALNPLAAKSGDDAELLRLSHLDTVASLAKKHGVGELPSVALQLYWTLYAGVLAFWARDRSPRQEDTLALLDHSLAMFTGWLKKEHDSAAPKTGTGENP
jgi:AcrR family transcriptional regulator